jgi:hypothetical protein
MRKFLATTAAGLALATGTVAVATFTPIGTAFAQSTSTTPTTQAAPTTPSTGTGTGLGKLREHRRAVAKAVLKDAAGVIGIQPKELFTDLKGGQSIADVATAHNVAPQAVIDKLVTDADARLDKAVADHKITQEQADKAKGKMTDRVTKIVDKHFDGSKKTTPTTK